jgi:hypothetical protein
MPSDRKVSAQAEVPAGLSIGSYSHTQQTFLIITLGRNGLARVDLETSTGTKAA